MTNEQRKHLIPLYFVYVVEDVCLFYNRLQHGIEGLFPLFFQRFALGLHLLAWGWGPRNFSSQLILVLTSLLILILPRVALTGVIWVFTSLALLIFIFLPLVLESREVSGFIEGFEGRNVSGYRLDKASRKVIICVDFLIFMFGSRNKILFKIKMEGVISILLW